MKVVLISMPDVIPIIIHEAAIHMPNHGIACLGGNVDGHHEVSLIDLIRKRKKIAPYLRKTLQRIKPDLIGLSTMTWQYQTCLALIGLIKEILPQVKIAVGGYHTTLMSQEMADCSDTDPVDFMIRGEGEETFRRLVNALEGTDRMDSIPGLSYKNDGRWVHNAPGALCDLSRLKLPIRDKRRLTGGYHFMYSKIEVLETSRGCTRNCNFCSINHMYGRSYRTYPIERIIADLDDIYFNKKTRLVFITDDNMVLNPKWVLEVCDAIIARKYRNLNLVVQADCISMAKNEAMVEKMAQAGFRSVFLGIENVSEQNLRTMEKAGVVEKARQAVANCHRHGIMVIGGLIFGLPDDDEEAVRRNYQFLNELEADASYCQMLSPFPKTPLREHLLGEGLVTNLDHYDRYNGLWANVKTRHLEADQLQYAFWYHRQVTLGWWNPSPFARSQGRLWTSAWTHAVKPVMKYFVDRQIHRDGWEKRYRQYIKGLEEMNRFEDLKRFSSSKETSQPRMHKRDNDPS
ncbi:MAG: radical SAM protein [Syntrophales bacterium]|nr:radical SAM protein [Syntrophales bacterium]